MSKRLISLAAGSSVLAAMTTEDLRSELAATLEITARHLLHIADVWCELQRRGEDLSHLRSGLWQYMSMIASGELQADLVVKYAGNATLLRHVATLPRYEQDLLLCNDTVGVVDYVDGNFRERKVSIQSLKRSEIRRVLNGKVLSREEQERDWNAHRARSSRRAASRDPAIVLQNVQKEQGEERVSRSVSLSLGTDEWAMLRGFAERANLPLATVIVASLRTTGVLRKAGSARFGSSGGP